MARIKDISDLSEFHELIKKEKHTIFELYADWSAALSRLIAPTYDKLADQHATTVECYRINTDKADEIRLEAGGTAMPTFVLYKDGERVDFVIGGEQKDLEGLFEKTKR